jgi:hypothetical protein
MATNTLVRYPQCGHEFDIEDAVAIQIKENIRTAFNPKASTTWALGSSQLPLVNELIDRQHTSEL